MNKKEILEFLNKNVACHLATMEGDQPRVRGMMMYRADDKGILFHTGSTKDLPKQLRANPKAEVCFNDFATNVQVRVTGVTEFIEDRGLKEEIVAARPFLKPWVDERGYDMLIVFRIKNCTATIWTFDKNFDPKEYIRL